MSTRSTIIAKIGEKYHGIYCHSDGYYDGVGATLLHHYNDSEKIEALITLGDISVLGEEIGEKHDFDWIHKTYTGGSWDEIKNDPRDKFTRAYHRDRGEPLEEIVKAHSWEEVARQYDNEYSYIHEDGIWYVSKNHRGRGLVSDYVTTKKAS